MLMAISSHRQHRKKRSTFKREADVSTFFLDVEQTFHTIVGGITLPPSRGRQIAGK